MVNVPLNIRAYGDYVVASRYLPFGQKLESGDIRVIEGDLSILPDDVLRSPRAAYDKVLGRPSAELAPYRQPSQNFGRFPRQIPEIPYQPAGSKQGLLI